MIKTYFNRQKPRRVHLCDTSGVKLERVCQQLFSVTVMMIAVTEVTKLAVVCFLFPQTYCFLYSVNVAFARIAQLIYLC